MVRWTANIATYHLSPNVRKRPFHLSHIINRVPTTGHLIINSGTNVSVMGRTWAVVDNTGRRCEMSGFVNDLVKSDIPVCSGKTVVEVDKHKVLLGLHEAPYLKDNEAWAPLYRSSTQTRHLCRRYTPSPWWCPTYRGRRHQWDVIQLRT